MRTFDLSQALKKLGIRQKEFAAMIDVTEETVSRWKREQRVPETVALYLDLVTKKKKKKQTLRK